ncbi:TPA: hypothetical protein JLK91_004001 [Escherichia coli]|uniref:Uncharacterized protein n=1 Tax=Escherichia coli TaxID=562 RepID=A0A6D0DED0_ECOLX|nr:type II toxin-antitoxin system RelE/ParE family toxin [Escherichia coli]EIK3125032.1 type II toxin-antitoxin system RelE/ParE family toxin [Escherichia coli]MVW15195.1 hypothetical protein [Escherichia coli]MWK98912.1 hypothetical protein [Escherichia coli]MWL03072.1 hypothetical protein [Escherichia coli]HAV8186375.1 hypothetical protein [Escherichia coli]
MEHLICINTNSFPASSTDDAKEMFTDAIEGVLELNEGQDRFTFYLDTPDNNSLAEFELADGYTFEEYTKDIESSNMDLYAFLLEVEDKSPAIENVSDDVFESISTFSFYVKGSAVDRFCDVFSFAWFMSATLLSLNSDEKWSSESINVCRTENGEYLLEDLFLNNISTFEHGRMLYDKYHTINLDEICGQHYIDKDFRAWFEGLDNDNARRVADKLELACKREFQGGEPLFKNLHNASGIREIRMNAYPGGALRILFKHYKDNLQAILIGFIKKNNSEGYDTAIELAEERFGQIT